MIRDRTGQAPLKGRLQRAIRYAGSLYLGRRWVAEKRQVDRDR